MQQRNATNATDFFDWLDTLTDDEHTAVLERLRQVADDLGIVIDRQPLVTHNLLDLRPHLATLPSLN